MKISEKFYIKILLTGIALLAIALPSLQCSSIQKGYHKYIMKGSIIANLKMNITSASEVKTEQKKGQILNVYEYVQSPFLYDDYPRNYKKKFTGKIKIVSVENIHYAKKVLFSGKTKKGSIVELK